MSHTNKQEKIKKEYEKEQLILDFMDGDEPNYRYQERKVRELYQAYMKTFSD